MANQPESGVDDGGVDPLDGRANGVKVVRAETLRNDMLEPANAGRATAFDFAGAGGRETWIGTVTLQPHSKTGAHHHGRHEVAVYVAKGHGRYVGESGSSLQQRCIRAISFTSHPMYHIRS